MSGTVHLLVGPEAGRGRAGSVHASVVATLRAEGIEVVEITGPDADASSCAAREAVADGAERLVVLGGDGLVHLALQAVAASNTVLGIVPAGTGNDFVRGLPDFAADAATAARACLGAAVPLDAIHDGRVWVASVATAGFSGDVNARANTLRFPRGPSRYTVATMWELPGLTLRDVTLIVDGKTHHHEAALLAVANTGWFGGGMQICPDADPTDGLLDVTVVADVGRIELLRFFRSVFSGRHLAHPKVHTHRGREVRIECDGLRMWGDGEPLDTAPTTLRAVPGAIRLAGVAPTPTVNPP